MESKIREAIKEHHLIVAGDRLLIGVSGGADSLALLYFFIQNREHLKCEIGAAHLHHDMRGKAADEDAAFVRDFCAEYDVPFYYRKTDVPGLAQSKKIGVESAGRLARYDFFEEIMIQEHYNKLATAHHLDDQAETLLMRLIRGTGISGAAGIRYSDGKMIRPMLSVSRDDIEAYCRENRLMFRHDSTNDDEAPVRNQLRHEVMPLLLKINSKANRHFAAYCQKAAEADAYIAAQTNLAAGRTLTNNGHVIRLCLPVWREEPMLIRKNLLRMALESACGIKTDIEERHIALLMNSIETMAQGTVVDMSHRVKVLKQYDDLLFSKDEIRMKSFGFYEVPVDASGSFQFENYCLHVDVMSLEKIKNLQKCKNGCEIFISCGTIKDKIFFRRRKTGDTILLPGVRGRKTVKTLMIDRKIPRIQRDSIPMLAMGSEVLWIPGIAVDRRCGLWEEKGNYIKFALENFHESRH